MDFSIDINKYTLQQFSKSALGVDIISTKIQEPQATAYSEELNNLSEKDLEYNKNIYAYTMQHAMLDLLENENTYPEFKDVIKNHFKFKKNKIIDICTKWSNIISNKSLAEKIKNKINKL